MNELVHAADFHCLIMLCLLTNLAFRAVNQPPDVRVMTIDAQPRNHPDPRNPQFVAVTRMPNSTTSASEPRETNFVMAISAMVMT